MKHFIARIVFRIEIAEKPDCIQFEEKTLMIKASDRNEAYDKSVAYGRSHEGSFVNTDGYCIGWLMLGTSALEQLDPDNEVFEFCSVLKDQCSDYHINRLLNESEQVRKTSKQTIIE